MPIASDSVFCIPTSSVDAWTQSSGPAGQQTANSDVQGVMQMVPGSDCGTGMTQLHVNTGATAAYLVAYDTRMPSTQEALMVFAFGFVLMCGAPRVLGALIREFRGLARRFW